METENAIRVEHAPVFDLDLELLGAMLMRLPAAARVGHTNITSTLAYVAIGEGQHEAQFLRDVLSLSASEMMEKWYGGHGNASRFAGELFARAIAPHRKAPADPAA